MYVVKRNGTEIDFDISKIYTAISKIFDSSPSLLDIDCIDDKERENYHSFLRIMAELDWPAFFEYTPELHSEVISFVKEGNYSGIEKTLYSYFGALFLKDLQDRLEVSPVISPLRLPALREALLLYQLGYFHGAVAILITQMEGIISDIDRYIINTGRTYSEKTLERISSVYKVSDQNEKGLVIKTILEAKDLDRIDREYDYMIGYLRMKILGGNPSDEDLCHHANRHKICHGSQCNYGTKEHALKTILCIDALNYVADVLVSNSDQPIAS